jgi:branched-chain amino acid transport system ATP-binding protein
MLQVKKLSAAYGQVTAVRDIDLSLDEGGILAVIGANGAGKSTLLKTIAGQLPAKSGSINFEGQDISALPAFERAKRGVVMVPEGRRLFPSLTVHENLQTALSSKRKGFWNLENVYDLFPLVSERKDRRAGNLSGGEQQATAIARALVANPRLLLLDEVSLGLAPAIISELYAILPKILAQGTSILLVEQDVSQALKVSDEVHCLLQGSTSLAGKNFDMAEISAAYFGSEVKR